MSAVVADIGCWESPLLYNAIFMNYMRCHDFLFFAQMEKEDRMQICKKWFINLYSSGSISLAWLMVHGLSLYSYNVKFDYLLIDRSSCSRF